MGFALRYALLLPLAFLLNRIEAKANLIDYDFVPVPGLLTASGMLTIDTSNPTVAGPGSELTAQGETFVITGLPVDPLSVSQAPVLLGKVTDLTGFLGLDNPKKPGGAESQGWHVYQNGVYQSGIGDWTLTAVSTTPDAAGTASLLVFSMAALGLASRYRRISAG